MNFREEIRQRNYQMCIDYGMTVTQHGESWRIEGHGVDISVNDLINVHKLDLVPVYQKH